MRLIVKIAVSLACLALCLPLLHDNRDQSLWQERVENQTFFARATSRMLLEDQHAYMQQQHQEQEQARKLKLKAIFAQTKNTCLNGKDPKSLTLEERVNEFIKGPCAPVVLVPGLAGTSLQIKINCQEMMEKNHETFSSCGWETCSAWQFWYSRPSEEYRLWISTTTSDIGAITISTKNHCFGNLMELQYDTAEKNHINKAGFEITYYGNTPQTKAYNECGLNGIQKMTDDYSIMYMMCDYKGFLNIGELLKNMGYVSGAMFQAIPYDYRRGIKINTAGAHIKQSVDNLHKITGKKAIILTHSLGSLHTLNFLNQQTQEYKDQKIATIMTMGAPYLGSSKAVRAHVGGDPSFLDTFLYMSVGINFYNQNRAINTASSQVDIYPKDTFYRFRGTEWMQQTLERMEQERRHKTNNSTKVTALSWFPTPDEKCSNLTTRATNCYMNLQDLKEPFMHIGGSKFSTENLNELLDKHTVNGSLIQTFLNDTSVSNLDNLQNPGVPYIVLYGGFSQTEYQFFYEEDPKAKVEKTGDFYFPTANKTTLGYGDTTVLTSSALIPAIKWIHEYESGQAKNPVKVIEFCALNKGGKVYNRVEDSGRRYFDMSQKYHGLECECMKSGQVVDILKQVNECKHSCMINDKYIVDLVSELIQTFEPSIIQKSPLSNQELEKHVSECSNLQ